MPGHHQHRRSTNERGYGTTHRALREAWRPRVEAGEVACWRCGHLIHPGQAWDLGHDDHDRSVYRGPEHVRCNRGSAAQRGNRQRARRLPPRSRHSRDWFGDQPGPSDDQPHTAE